MRANQALCLFVHDRIKVLWERLDSSDLVSEASRILYAYHKFHQIVAQRENILEQLMTQREVLATLKQFQLEIDTLFTRLNIDERQDWNVQWQMHQSEMAKAFRFRVVRDEKLVKNAKSWKNRLGHWKTK